MADIPSEAPHHTAQKAASGIGGVAKKIPTWGWIAIAGLILIFVMYKRHQTSQKAAVSNSAGAAASQTDPNNPNASDPNAYGASTTGLDQAYLSGYDSGIYSNAGSGGGGFLPSGTGTDGQTANPITPGTSTSTVTVNTGGGPPKRSATMHERPKGVPKNAVWGGPNKPGPNYRGVGGGWWVPGGTKSKVGGEKEDKGKDKGGDK